MHRLFIKLGEYMDYTKILQEFNNNAQIIYLDSSCLIRDYPINVISKNLTRTKYNSNPQKFTNILNRLINPLHHTSALLYNILDETIKQINKINIITYDCMFPSTNNEYISALFGSFDFIGSVASINNSIILYGDEISVETFFNASTLVRSANLIIIDDYFLSLSIGKHLLNQKKDNTITISLSSVIGHHSYHTEEVINIFKYICSNYCSQ